MNKAWALKIRRLLVVGQAVVLIAVFGMASGNATGYVNWTNSSPGATRLSQIIQPMNLVSGVAWKSQFDLFSNGEVGGVGVMGVNDTAAGILAEARIDYPTNFLSASGSTCTYAYDGTVKYLFSHRTITFSAADKFENVFERQASDTTNTWWDISVNNLTTGESTSLGSVQIAANTVVGGITDYTYAYG